MKVYSVTPDEGAIEGESFYTNKADACGRAKHLVESGATLAATVTLTKVREGKGRSLFVCLLNREGWAADGGETVMVYSREAKGPER